MPLQDHLNPPQSAQQWSSFLMCWANSIRDALRQSAPAAFITEIQPQEAGQTYDGEIEVQLRLQADPTVLIATIVLVSPRNKRDQGERRPLISKCANYLRKGVGLVLVDIVASGQPNLHDDLVVLFGYRDATMADKECILANVYQMSDNALLTWTESLHVGNSLPTVRMPLDAVQRAPVAIRAQIGRPQLRLNLEAAYMAAIQSANP